MTERVADSVPTAIHPAPAKASRLAPSLWKAAVTLQSYIDGPIVNQELWHLTTRLARLSENAVARARALANRRRVLVLLEDWCGDAMFTVPFAERLVAQNASLALRVLQRDMHPALMDMHCTNGSRSIPVVMLFDERGIELAWWGPRPSPLQHWVVTEGLGMAKPLRYKGIRTWYARDRGETTLHELLTMLEQHDNQ
ncbi:MAG: thioredoxin family protein [Gemmatimonas sp.]